ncbi:MAG: YihY/virulence factor BrkB family protein [Bacilli bacterium]|nr:YihY/virulence factor BrkB family protein [Bacilli bacterium]MDD4298356.1 YihY/virulence factor BrkB family protein [Bacilli bacterium]MDD4643797.1 YihY/virulence factor BrkB family protein [Bacilli bacterium]
MLKRVTKLFNEIKEINKNSVMSVLPGQLAFFFVLSIPPLISLVGIIAGMLSISTYSFISFITSSFPASTSNIIIPIIEGKGLDISIIIFIISALIMISNGTYAIIVTSNALYKVEAGNNIKRRIKAFFLVLMLIFLLAFIIIVPAFGDLIMSLLKNINYVNNIYEELMFVYNVIKLPISFIFIYFIIKIIYTIAPDKNVKSRDVTYGAVFTTTFWVVATKIYSYYVTHIANYNLFYGSIANLIILLLWFYLLSYIFVLGMALNAGKHSLELNEEKGS